VLAAWWAHTRRMFSRGSANRSGGGSLAPHRRALCDRGGNSGPHRQIGFVYTAARRRPAAMRWARILSMRRPSRSTTSKRQSWLSKLFAGLRLCDFNYVPVLSRADGAWAGRRGYVQDAVTADLAISLNTQSTCAVRRKGSQVPSRPFSAAAHRSTTSTAKASFFDARKRRRHNGHLDLARHASAPCGRSRGTNQRQSRPLLQGSAL
jgi:hypothetical protein